MNLDSDQREKHRQQSVAVDWISRVLAVCVVMVLPGFGGLWLDQKLDTGYWTVLGFVFGFASGFTALILLVKRNDGGPKQTRH